MKKSFWLWVALIALLLAAVFTAVVAAQTASAADLTARLRQRGVPVIQVTVDSRLPYRVTIELQSQSESGVRSEPKDHWNMLLANREATQSYRFGARLSSFTLVVRNPHGDVISSFETFLYPEDPSQKLSPGPAADDQAVAEWVTGQLAPGKMQIDSLEVFSEGMPGYSGQVLALQVSAADLDNANNALPVFLESYFRVLEVVNTEGGANLALTHLRVVDEQGEVLLDYVKDLQGLTMWSLAPGVYHDWIPVPPAIESEDEPSAEPTAYPAPVELPLPDYP